MPALYSLKGVQAAVILTGSAAFALRADLSQTRWRSTLSRSTILLLFAGLVCEQGGVGADGVRKDLIQLAGDDQLVLLQLRKTANHKCVFEVGSDHCLEKVHVVRAELSQALVHHAAEIAITLATIFLHTD